MMETEILKNYFKFSINHLFYAHLGIEYLKKQVIFSTYGQIKYHYTKFHHLKPNGFKDIMVTM